MKLTFDPKYNIAYLKISEKSNAVNTVQVSDELNVDLAPDGSVYGIEFMNANEQLISQDGGKLVFLNNESGIEKEMVMQS